MVGHTGHKRQEVYVEPPPVKYNQDKIPGYTGFANRSEKEGRNTALDKKVPDMKAAGK
jgi:hypothetical protein